MSSDKPRVKKPLPRIPRPVIPIWVWWTVFAALFAWNAVMFLAPRGAAPVELSYSAFLKQVQDGNVTKVTISGQKVDGQLKHVSPDPGSTPIASATPGAHTAVQNSDQFTTTQPTSTDSSLLAVLQSNGVDVTVVDVSRGSWVLTIVTSLLPVLLL